MRRAAARANLCSADRRTSRVGLRSESAAATHEIDEQLRTSFGAGLE